MAIGVRLRRWYHEPVTIEGTKKYQNKWKNVYVKYIKMMEAKEQAFFVK